MRVGKVVVDAKHTVVLTGATFVRRDQFPGSISIVWSVRSGHQIEKLWYQRINRNRDTTAGTGVVADGRIASGWQQSLMREGIGYRSNCRGCLNFAKPLIIGKEECAITL